MVQQIEEICADALPPSSGTLADWGESTRTQRRPPHIDLRYLVCRLHCAQHDNLFVCLHLIIWQPSLHGSTAVLVIEVQNNTAARVGMMFRHATERHGCWWRGYLLNYL